MATLSGPEVVVEGETATYTVTLTGGVGSADITISYEVTGTATEDVDYMAPSGEVVIAASDGQTLNTTKTFLIAIKTDDVQEVGETLIVTLTGATTEKGMVALGSPDQVTTMIRSADTVLVTVGDKSQTETDASGQGMEFTASLAVPSTISVTGVVTIGYAIVAGSATEGVDYTAPAPGSTVEIALVKTIGRQTFPVPILSDMLTEADETFTVMLTLVDAPNGVDVAFESSTATGTIMDDDGLTASVQAQRGTEDSEGTVTGSVIEGSTTTFTVSLAGGTSTTPVVVGYTTEPPSTVTYPATVAVDYEEPSGTITIPAGESTGTITIMTLPDDLLERDETLTVTLLQSGTTTAAGSVMIPIPPIAGASAMTTIGDSGRKVTVSVADIDGGRRRRRCVHGKAIGKVLGRRGVELCHTRRRPDRRIQRSFGGGRYHHRRHGDGNIHDRKRWRMTWRKGPNRSP